MFIRNDKVWRVVSAVLAAALGSCSGDPAKSVEEVEARVAQMRDTVAAMPLDTAKANYFFPDDFAEVRAAWERSLGDSNRNLDTINAAFSSYVEFHARVNAIAWISTFGGDGYEEAAQVLVRPTSGYLVLGDTTSFGAGQRDAFLVEIDPHGHEDSRFTHGGPENDSARTALREGDDYVVAGRTSSFNDWTGDAYCFRTTRSGEVMWEQHFGVAGTDSLEAIVALDEGYFVAGNTFEGGGGRNIVVARVARSGEIDERTVLPGDEDEWINAGMRMDDGHMLLAGGRGAVNATAVRFLLLVLDASGSVVSEWTYAAAGVATTGLAALAPAPEGGFYALGQTQARMEDSEDLVLMRIDRRGDVVWRVTVGGDDAEYGGGLAVTPEGDVVFAATTHSYGAGGADILLVKYRADGTEMWARTLGSAEDESARTIALAPDGGFIVAGERGTFIEGIQDLYVVKTNADGVSWLGAPFGTDELRDAPVHETPGPRQSIGMPDDALDVGDEAPAFTATTWYNVPEQLQSLFAPNAELHAESIGAPLLVVEFWATWCGPCRVTIPHLNALQTRYKDQGVLIVSLTDEDPAQAPVESFMREHRMETIVGAGSPSGVPFQAWAIPHAFLIDRYGKVVWYGHPMGGLDEAIAEHLGEPAAE